MMAPLAAAIEPCAALFIKALPNFVPSLPCQDILTERRGVHLIALVTLSCFFSVNGVQLAAVEANPRATRLLWHTMLFGSGACVVFPLWYASAASSPSTISIIANSFLTAVVCNLVPHVSFAVWGLATAKRRSCKRARSRLRSARVSA